METDGKNEFLLVVPPIANFQGSLAFAFGGQKARMFRLSRALPSLYPFRVAYMYRRSSTGLYSRQRVHPPIVEATQLANLTRWSRGNT